MPSLCPVCQETFEHWAEYHEHINVFHAIHATPAQIAANAPKPISRREWTGPMDKALKRSLVAKREAQIGFRFFIGGDK